MFFEYNDLDIKLIQTNINPFFTKKTHLSLEDNAMKTLHHRKSGLGTLVTCFFVILFICQIGHAQSITRLITDSGTNTPSVTLTVTPDSGTTSYYVVEFLVAELTPTFVTDGGIVSYGSGTIQWGPFEDNLPRTFSYRLMGSTTAFELAGFAKFSSDPPEVSPKSYYKVYTDGDKVGTNIAPITHSISVLEPGVVYTVTTRHFTVYSGQPVSHPTFYPELHLLNGQRNNILAIRAYHGPEGTGFATMKKTAPYTTPIEWNIPELEVISVTGTPISNPEGIELTWTFRLSATTLWDVYEESICLGTFTITDAGDYGAYCDLSNLTYTGGIPKVFKGRRGIYVWKEGYYIATNPQNQRDFFSFCAAPKGKANNKIESIIIAFPQDINGAEAPLFRSFIAEAHSRGMEVNFVTGEPEWSFLDNRQIGTDEINKIFTFNQSAVFEEQFDSIQFDVEPHAIDTDNEPGMEPWVWEQFIPNMAYFKSVVDQNNIATGLNIPFVAAIGNFWHEDYVPTDAYPGPGYEQILNIIDKAAIMNYVTHSGAVYTCREELEYSRLLNKPIDIVYETFNTSPTESFWFNGNNALERTVNSIDYAYVDPFSTDYYENFGFNVIHYYEAADEIWPHNGVIKRSYRQLRPDIFSDQEPLDPVYNTAPVCYVLSPNGGEETSGRRLTITYSVYDDNSAVPISVKFYLRNTASGSEYYLGTQSVQVSASTHMYSGSFNATVNAYPVGTDYRIRITVDEQSGSPALSSFDSSNYDFARVASGGGGKKK
ncbi:MAG: hypothetical protein C4541_13470 [Candidatus Auribacter fodinae]|uniref:Uncharacterized protein n=1 Tax=Candidatus Auribacter fodinae TaxID=2093366 RepID=A0A3A4R158_9BACT|nr:MAG: hypothetical protein C4541_13470 [Candidatus Auribacter fodinae]